MPKPIIVLVSPQLPENIGMVARAMANMGIDELRIVSPREPINVALGDKAYTSATFAAEYILKSTKVFNDLATALNDITFCFATTARDRVMSKDIYTPQDAMLKAKEKINLGGKVAIVFGAERSGMENDDIAITNAIINIPTSKVSSLNLAQAVLIVGYSWLVNNNEYENTIATIEDEPATIEDMEAFFNYFLNSLKEVNFFKTKEQEPIMIRNIKNIFLKRSLSKQEVKTMYGAIKYIKGR